MCCMYIKNTKISTKKKKKIKSSSRVGSSAGLSIRQTRQMPRAYEGKGPAKVIKEAHKSKDIFF